MEAIHKINPFSKREEHSSGSVLTYKILTIASWFLVHVANIHYAWNSPAGYDQHTIWGQNRVHQTPFALNPFIVDVYWVILLFLQIGYLYNLFTGPNMKNSADVAAHFIVNNLFMFAFVMLWVHAHFWIAELMLVLNFFNLSSLYFRHSTYALWVHLPVVSGPLAWNFVALFWCGAVMVGAHDLLARIFANIAIWGFLGYGLFFNIAFKDYTMSFNLSVLTASLGVHQFLYKVVALQWIFAFIIMGILFVMSVLVAIPGVFGSNVRFGKKGAIVSEDREREPLLANA